MGKREECSDHVRLVSFIGNTAREDVGQHLQTTPTLAERSGAECN